MHHRTTALARRRRPRGRATLALLAVLVAASASGATVASGDQAPAPTDPAAAALASGADLPAGCEYKAKPINSRARKVRADTYIHRMSNAPNCSPHGPIDGTAKADSTFNVYFSDAREPEWCYGYSVNAGIKGYVLCSALRVP